MRESNISLFGKHPAWSDHMFVGTTEGVASQLKRVFYDHSMIPALQGTADSDGIPDPWSVLAFIQGHRYYIVSTPSLDSVGRTRFPLFAAYALPDSFEFSGDSGLLKALKLELLSLLQDLLIVPEKDDLSVWQEFVLKKVKTFSSAVNWEQMEALSGDELTSENLACLMAHLSEERITLSLQGRAFLESCQLALAARIQFRTPVTVALLFNEDFSGNTLFVATGSSPGFYVDQFLKGHLPYLKLPGERIPEKVAKLVDPSSEENWSVANLPSLKLGGAVEISNVLEINRKYAIIATFIALLGAALIGIIISGIWGGKSGSVRSGLDSHIESFPARDAWIKSASDYVDWIRPLEEYVEANEDVFAEAQYFLDALELDLNPFKVVNNGEIRMDLVKNPTNRIFQQSNLAELEVIHGNVAKLRSTVQLYFEKNDPISFWNESPGAGSYGLPAYLSHLELNAPVAPPEFGPSLPRQFRERVDDCLSVSEVALAINTIESEVFHPLESDYPEHVNAMRQNMAYLIRNSDAPISFRSEFSKLEQIFSREDFPAISDLEIESLSLNMEWRGIVASELSDSYLQEILLLLIDFRKVDPSEFQELSKSLLVAASKVERQVDLLRTDFPGLDFDKDSANRLLDQVELYVETFENNAPIQRNYSLALENTRLLSSELDDLWTFFRRKHEQAADPENWMSQLDDYLAMYELDAVKNFIRIQAEKLKARIISDSDIDRVQGYQRFRRESDDLISTCRLIDTAFMAEQSELHRDYLARNFGRERIQTYVEGKLVALQPLAGDVDDIKQKIINLAEDIAEILQTIVAASSDIESRYALMNTDANSPQELRRRLRELVALPLYLSDRYAEILAVLDSATEGKVNRIDRVEDLYWYLSSATAEAKLTKEILSQSVLDYASFGGVVDRALKEAFVISFDKYAERAAVDSSLHLLTLFRDLDLYLPSELQTERHKDNRSMAEYWASYVENPNPSVPSEVELERLEQDAGTNGLRGFYRDLLEVRGMADELAGESGLKKMADTSSVIDSVYYDKARSRIEITFSGEAVELSFIAVKTGSGVIFVQAAPLTLIQYIELSSLCELDTEDYLFSQDNVWPRSYEIGTNKAFFAWEQWQFLNGDVFESLGAFEQKSIPAHVNEPTSVKRMAEACGFRLFYPDEVDDFASILGKPDASLVFSTLDKSLLQEYGVAEDSVYRAKIEELAIFNGGIDFARSKQSDDQFVEVQGGSAELAYYSGQYYAFGGSWLYTPTSLDELESIDKPNRMYVDLGVRFVFDAPAPTYVELIEQVATQTFSKSER